MTRRKLLKLVGLPGVLALGGIGYAAAARARNSYYEGPVSDHFDGVQFFVPGRRTERGLLELMRWQLEGGRADWPEAYPSPFRDRPPERVEGLRVALAGHASFLIQVAGLNLLVDPHWSERASPVSFVGPKRANPPGIAFEDLPPIDAVLVTHNHYDHLDRPTLARLFRRRGKPPRFIMPLGNARIAAGEDTEFLAAITEVDWGQSVTLPGGAAVHCEPSYHWSARGVNDRRMALWCAFVVTTAKGAVYHVGDSAYGEGAIFRSVLQRFGPPRVVLLPIGAYEPRWFMQTQHLNPDDAVRAFKDCGAEQALGHHWGTFQLTNEAIEQPIEDLAVALTREGVEPRRFRAMRPGEVWEG